MHVFVGLQITDNLFNRGYFLQGQEVMVALGQCCDLLSHYVTKVAHDIVVDP